MKRTDIDMIAKKFEKKYGTDILLKTAFSSLTKLLVKRGIFTEDEIYSKFIDEVKYNIEYLSKKDEQ